MTFSPSAAADNRGLRCLPDVWNALATKRVFQLQPYESRRHAA